MESETAGTDAGAKTGEPAWPNPRYAWYVVIVLTLTYTLAFMDRQIIALLVGPIKEDLGVTDFQISLLQGIAFASVYTLMGLPLGWLADRRNRRNLIAAGLVIWSAMTVACGLSRNFVQLFTARLGVGVGQAALGPNAYSMISDYFPPDKLSRALSVYFLGVYLGAGLANIMGGLIIDIVGGMGEISAPLVGVLAPWQIAFIAAGLPGLLFVFLFITVREPLRRGRLQPAEAALEGADAGPSIKSVLRYLEAHRSIYLPFVLAFSFHALFAYGAAYWVPEFLMRTHDLARSDAAYLYGSIILVGSTAGVLTGGWLGGWLEARGHTDAKLRIALYGNLALIPAAAIFPLLSDLNTAIPLIVMMTFFAAFPYGLAAAALQVITPNEMRGLISALYLFVLNIIGLGLGPSAIAFFTDFVFSDPDKLGWSITATALVALLLSTFFLYRCLKPFRAIVATGP